MSSPAFLTVVSLGVLATLLANLLTLALTLMTRITLIGEGLCGDDGVAAAATAAAGVDGAAAALALGVVVAAEAALAAGVEAFLVAGVSGAFVAGVVGVVPTLPLGPRGGALALGGAALAAGVAPPVDTAPPPVGIGGIEGGRVGPTLALSASVFFMRYTRGCEPP